MLVRSPIMMKLVSGRIVSGSSPLKLAQPVDRARTRGALPCTACAIWRMYSGVVPQQPPMMLSQPLAANSAIVSAMCSGGSS